LLDLELDPSKFNFNDFSIMKSQAIHDISGKKRYLLIKTWDETKPIVTSLLFNPNDATSLTNDKTVNNIINIVVNADDCKYGTLIVVNLIPTKSKSPKMLQKEEKLEEDTNIEFLEKAFNKSEIILVGWGTDGGKLKNFPKTKKLLHVHKNKLKCLGTTGNNIPCHPSRKTDKVTWMTYKL